jgi:hypothetical protein
MYLDVRKGAADLFSNIADKKNPDYKALRLVPVERIIL